MPDVLDIREELLNLIDNSDPDTADGFWAEAQAEPSFRNSFSLRLTPDGPIFTVAITVGGALTGSR